MSYNFIQRNLKLLILENVLISDGQCLFYLFIYMFLCLIIAKIQPEFSEKQLFLPHFAFFFHILSSHSFNVLTKIVIFKRRKNLNKVLLLTQYGVKISYETEITVAKSYVEKQQVLKNVYLKHFHRLMFYFYLILI